MDLNLYLRVIWRFRVLVATGFLVAVLLAFLSFAKVSFSGGSPKVSYRKPPVYGSQAVIFVTQRGFPIGRAVFPTLPPGSTKVAQNFADYGRLAGIAILYGELAQTDVFKALLLKNGAPANASIGSGVEYDQATQSPQPLLQIQGVSTSKQAAVDIANIGAATLRTYVARQQAQAKIPVKERVQLQLVSPALKTKVLATPKKTVPIAVFLTVVLATLGLALILENLRPKIRKVEAAPEADQPASASNRLTA